MLRLMSLMFREAFKGGEKISIEGKGTKDNGAFNVSTSASTQAQRPGYTLIINHGADSGLEAVNWEAACRAADTKLPMSHCNSSGRLQIPERPMESGDL